MLAWRLHGDFGSRDLSYALESLIKKIRIGRGHMHHVCREGELRRPTQAYQPAVSEIGTYETYREISGAAVLENVLKTEPADVRAQT